MLLNIGLLLFTLILSLLPDPSNAIKTIPDVLYKDSRFSNLVTALQRTRLLRDINHFETATLFAPVNDAFDDDPFITKERMLYHFLFSDVKKEELLDGKLLTTRMELQDKLGPGSIGQRVKVENETSGFYVGNGKVTEFDLQADNGIIHVITEVLRIPMDVYTTLSSIEQLQVFSEYLHKRGLDEYLSSGNHITIFAPTNDAIKSQLKFHEREYLMGECGGGLEDLDLWTKHHLHYDRVLYSETFERGVNNVTTVQGEPIKVEKDEGGNIRVADGNVTFKDLLAENGVIHIITNAATPLALKFTTHKYLCGLKATKFVAAMIKYALQHYIEGSETSYTILAPGDEYFDEAKIGHDVLRYHIVEGKYSLSNLTNNMHIKTELRTKDLRNHRQRATVSFVKKWDKSEETLATELQFNGAGVIGEPIEIGNDIIYILSKTMTPPPSIISIFDGDKQLMSIRSYILISNMVPTVRSAKGVTMFAPSTEAFKKLGLLNSYFLHQDARDELRSVISYHIINETIYSEDIPEGESTYYTIDGDQIKVHKINGDIFVNNANSTSEVSRRDVLTSTGVLHILDQVMIPPTLHITLGKLLKGINAQTFLDIVRVANLTELVQDPIEPFTILAPTENAFKKVNVSKLLADADLAGRWARLHIIPRKIDSLEDNYEVPTLLSDDAKLIIKKDMFGKYYIEVKGYWGFEEKAKLLGSGKAWNGGAVYEIDKVLLPEHVTQIGRTFLDMIVSIVIAGLVLICGTGGWHFWKITRGERQGYQEIPSSSS